MKEHRKKGIGLRHALNGLKELWIRERNFKIHIFSAILAIIFGFLLQISKYEWLIVIIAIQSVIITEAINSVIERIIDYVKPEISDEAKIIKDISAAFVLIAAISAIIIGIIIFLPKIIFGTLIH